MLIRSFRAECIKLRRSFIWLALAVLPLLSAVMGTFNYLNNLGILTQQWYSLWTQHSLFYCALFAPALTGVYCAYVCRLEHLGRNWNSVMTMPVAPAHIFFAKLAIVSLLSALTQLLIGALFLLFGKLAGLTAPVPPELFLWLIRGWWALTVEAALLLCVALVIRSFAIPVGLGILGGFCGIAAFAKGIGAYFPFSLLQLSMCTNKPDEPMQCAPQLFAATSTLFFLAACAFGVLWLKKRDVKTA